MVSHVYADTSLVLALPPNRPFGMWYIIRLSPKFAGLFTGWSAVQLFRLFVTVFVYVEQQDPALSAGSSAQHPVISRVLLVCLGYDAHAVWKSRLLNSPDSRNSSPASSCVSFVWVS